jgi:hypothetical protein
MTEKLYLYVAIISLLIGIKVETSQGEVVGLVETTYDDANWVICASDLILRENLCGWGSGGQLWYEKVFNPCYGQTWNRYWRIVPGEQSPRAFPMGTDQNGLGHGSFDGLYVRDCIGFQIYDNDTYPSNPNDLIPYGPYMVGPQYVDLNYWEPLAPDGFEPGTFFVVGGPGGLKDYSIIIYTNTLSLEKTSEIIGSDPNFAIPGDHIIYTITYGPNGFDRSNVKITDFLSCKVDYENLSDPNYDAANHKYTWQIGSLDAAAGNDSVMLTVRVNEAAEPNSVIINSCWIIGDFPCSSATIDTNIGAWEPVSDIVYVDGCSPCSSPGIGGTGMSWRSAYIDLEDGLARARSGNVDEIKVAKGEYIPSVPSGAGATFNLVDGVKLYGGYPSGGGQRDWLANETILKKGQDTINYVVKANGVGSVTVIDGFTIKGGNWAGIGCQSNAGPVISHNKITQNWLGIESINSNPKITKCIVCINTDTGVVCTGGAPIIDNIVDYSNGNASSEYGIAVYSGSTAIVRNSTIAKNYDYGIHVWDAAPTVSNCIFWNNKSNGQQVSGVTPTYSCIQNWSGSSSYHNINTDPCFVDAPNYNYRLRYNSPCIDTGDSNVVEVNETDIYGLRRLLDGDGNGTYIVDRGASEYCKSAADFDDSCDVDLFDYIILVAAWKSTDSNANYNEKCDLWDDNFIDYKDLDLFCNEWLGNMCRYKDQMMDMGEGGDGLLGGEGMEFSMESFGFEDDGTVYEPELPPEPAPASEIDPNVIEEMLDWIDETWQNGQFEGMSEDEYLQFRTEIQQLSNQ